MDFKVKFLSKPRIKDIVLIVGLPGIGNVGKVAIDFMIENLKAKKFAEITSYYFPHSVFVNEDNLIEVPSISLYYKKVGRNNLVFMAGDVQPIDEVSCYSFCDHVLDALKPFKVREVVTTGGIGLQTVPKRPDVYVTGNDEKFMKTFRLAKMEIYGVVGPIIGVSGVLLGTAMKKKIKAASLLAQTFGHPSYLGIKGSRMILKVFDRKYSLKLNIKRLDEEIDEIETEIKVKTQKLAQMQKASEKMPGDMSYFG